MKVNQKLIGITSFVLLLMLMFSPIFVKGAQPTPITTITTQTQITQQQLCNCQELEQNYSSCLKNLIQTNESLQSCSSITYYSVVNQMYQEINNINVKINVVYIVLAIDITISFFTLLKAFNIEIPFIKAIFNFVLRRKKQKESSIL